MCGSCVHFVHRTICTSCPYLVTDKDDGNQFEALGIDNVEMCVLETTLKSIAEGEGHCRSSSYRAKSYAILFE